MNRIFIPCGDVFKTFAAGVKEARWFNTDSEERFIADPHPYLGPEDVSYRFNEYGFRCREFSDRSEINVISMGCSWTIGMGLPYEYTFSEMFCAMLSEYTGKSVTNWNLAIPGKSNDYMSRVLLNAVPLLKPDIGIICFTAASRREYFDVSCHNYDLMPTADPETPGLLKITKEIYEHYYGLASKYDDQMNFYKNYKLIEMLMNQHDIKWAFTSVEDGQVISKVMKALTQNLDMEKFLGFGPERVVDFGRDNQHPGIKSSTVFTEKLFSKFMEIYEGQFLSVQDGRARVA